MTRYPEDYVFRFALAAGSQRPGYYPISEMICIFLEDFLNLGFVTSGERVRVDRFEFNNDPKLRYNIFVRKISSTNASEG